MTHHLVGVAEVAAMLGVTRQRVNAIVRTHGDFPAAEAELAAGRIWKRTAVEKWMRNNGRVQTLGVEGSDRKPGSVS